MVQNKQQKAPVNFCSPGLKKALIRLGICSAEQFEQLAAKDHSSKIISILEKELGIDQEGLLGRLAAELKLERAELQRLDAQQMVCAAQFLEKMGEGFALEHRCLSFDEKGKKIMLACVDPLDTETIRAIEFVYGCPVTPYLVKESDLLHALRRLGDRNVFKDAVSEVTDSSSVSLEFLRDEGVEQESSVKAGSESAPVVRLVNNMLLDGFEQKASDIHLEPTALSLEVRLRVDGVLSNYLSIPKKLQSYVCTRLKLLAGMDITERRRPQDGRFRIYNGPAAIGDARASTVPTPFGEKIVLRLLRSEGAQGSLELLGLPPAMLTQLTAGLTARDRMIVVTGPTGSGKSTTLYTMLKNLTQKASNIITVEDPIEYRVEGITQIQVDEKVGMTFAAGLRSILRQDPDIIMVGEIRDAETAEIGMQAAQTGHLVLTTLHTNTAASAVVRLLDLGLEPYVIASSLGLVLAQRLVRRLCPDCARTLSDDEKRAFEKDYGVRSEHARAAVGCLACENSGYRGRIGVYSLLTVDTEVRELIRQGAGEDAIEQAARKNGMTTLGESAIELVAQGVTTVEEFERILGTVEKKVDNRTAPKNSKRSPVGEISRKETEIEHLDMLKAMFISGAEQALEEIDPGMSVISSSTRRGEVSAAELSIKALVSQDQAIDTADLGNRRVLIVDDEPGVRAVMGRALRRAGFEICEAEDGEAALEMLSEFPIDAVLCDLLMPGMDGETLLKALRNDEKTKTLPVLMLTGSDNEENEIRLIGAGANDFISKCSSPSLVITRLRRLLHC